MKRKVEFFFLCFFAYSILGWCYEVFLEVIVYRWGFSNRGFLFGPYCPVYGFGALLFIFTLSGLKKKRIELWKWNCTPFIVFFATMLLATAVELATSYLLEMVTGSWLWNYSTYHLNFQGRIALNPSLRFGLGGVLFLYVLQPIFEKVDQKMNTQNRHALFLICSGIMMIDCLIKIV